MTKVDRRQFEISALCFPTPRDANTDRITKLFDTIVNLSPHNKSECITNIIADNNDFLLFADASLDSRVFALTHERMALWQGLIWSWGGTMGIPTIDYYFIPEILWTNSMCPTLHGGFVPPQALFAEQIVLLEDLPDIPRPAAMDPTKVGGLCVYVYVCVCLWSQ
jgi:hypothetical protein